MAKKFSTLCDKMSPESLEASNNLAQKLKAEMPLQELREAYGLSQTAIADILSLRQPTISKMEKSVDMYISTLRNFVSAMGGTLRISADFPEGTVVIRNFTDLHNDKNQTVEQRVIKGRRAHYIIKSRSSSNRISAGSKLKIPQSSNHFQDVKSSALFARKLVQAK